MVTFGNMENNLLSDFNRFGSKVLPDHLIQKPTESLAFSDLG